MDLTAILLLVSGLLVLALVLLIVVVVRLRGTTRELEAALAERER